MSDQRGMIGMKVIGYEKSMIHSFMMYLLNIQPTDRFDFEGDRRVQVTTGGPTEAKFARWKVSDGHSGNLTIIVAALDTVQQADGYILVLPPHGAKEDALNRLLADMSSDYYVGNTHRPPILCVYLKMTDLKMDQKGQYVPHHVEPDAPTIEVAQNWLKSNQDNPTACLAIVGSKATALQTVSKFVKEHYMTIAARHFQWTKKKEEKEKSRSLFPFRWKRGNVYTPLQDELPEQAEGGCLITEYDLMTDTSSTSSSSSSSS